MPKTLSQLLRDKIAAKRRNDLAEYALFELVDEVQERILLTNGLNNCPTDQLAHLSRCLFKELAERHWS